MFTLHTSNKTENLLAHWVKVAQMQPLSSPFEPEVFLIQSQGMERWLSQGIADSTGVCANAQFLFPGHFFNHITALLNQDLSVDFFARESLVWRIEALLRQLSDWATAESADGLSDAASALRVYLQGDHLELKRFKLAQQLAQVFDQYQLMRCEMLDAWQQGRCVTHYSAEQWQQQLWQALCQQSEQVHRGQAWLQVIKYLQNKPQVQGLPERISVFGLTTMPPLFLQFLHALARHTQVHVYVMQPCEYYWGDIGSGKQIKIQQLQPEQLEQADDISHPLLSMLGQQGREFQQMILEQGHLDWEFDSFEPFAQSLQPSALQRLQETILAGQLSAPLALTDDSIQLMSCHTPMRELEVLKDALLQQLNQDPELELRDIVVMAPDISIYEPFISAVFDESRFRYSIADRSLRSSNELLDTLIAMLKLLGGRFEWSSVLDVLEREAVYPCFDLNAQDLDYIRHWVEQTHIRWGRDPAHRESLGLPALEQNTWRSGLARMMWGFVKSDTGIDLEGGAAQALGGLDSFVTEVLFHFAEQFKHAYSLADWSQQLLQLTQISLQDNDYQQLAALREILQTLADQPSEQSFTLDVIIDWLEGAAGEHKTSQGFLAGQLTFCSMLPMRSIPFKVIALLGLNEGVFPRIDRRPSFDLMGLPGQFRQGDRSVRRDDRYQFLDALLSARQTLYLSYIGQSVQSNEAIPPSIVISELQQCIELAAQRQPLHAFSKCYFDGSNSELFSFNSQAATIAQAFVQAGAQQKTIKWWQGHLPADEDAPANRVALDDMLRFVRDPQLYFMHQVMGIGFDEVKAPMSNTEPFTIDALQNYSINERLVAAKLESESAYQRQRQHLRQSGEWLSGCYGEIKLTQQLNRVETFCEFLQRVLASLGAPQAARFIDFSQDGVSWQGWLEHQYQLGQIHYRLAKLKAKDFLQAWIKHLVADQPSWVLGLDAQGEPIAYQFKRLNGAQAEQQRKAWLALFQQAQQQPSALWPEAAWAYVQAKPDKSYDVAYKSLHQALHGMTNFATRSFIPPRAEVAKLYQGYSVDELLNDDFVDVAKSLIEPIYNALTEVSV